MTTTTTTIDHLERMAHVSPGLLIYADTARGVYRLRKGQCWFEAPMTPAPSPDSP